MIDPLIDPTSSSVEATPTSLFFESKSEQNMVLLVYLLLSLVCFHTVLSHLNLIKQDAENLYLSGL